MTKRKPIIFMLTGILALLGFMLTVQLSTLSSQKNKPSTTDYATLLSEVTQQQQENQLLNKQIAQAQTQLQTYKASGDNAKQRTDALLSDFKSVQKQAGLTPVTGPGIVLTLSADPSLSGYNQFSTFPPDVVLPYIVNLLYAQGATAMSIQGSPGQQQRLVTTSAIRSVISAGMEDTTSPVINNDYILVMPYTIRAVGNVQRMKAILTAESLQQQLSSDWGVSLTVTTPKKVTVAAYTAPVSFTYAKEVNSQ